jgi:hypothetical protein
MVDRWMSHTLTRGILFGECHGATWPSLGLPRGTPPLVVWEKFYGLHRSRTYDLQSDWNALAGLGYQPGGCARIFPFLGF